MIQMLVMCRQSGSQQVTVQIRQLWYEDVGAGVNISTIHKVMTTS